MKSALKNFSRIPGKVLVGSSVRKDCRLPGKPTVYSYVWLSRKPNIVLLEGRHDHTPCTSYDFHEATTE